MPHTYGSRIVIRNTYGTLGEWVEIIMLLHFFSLQSHLSSLNCSMFYNIELTPILEPILNILIRIGEISYKFFFSRWSFSTIVTSHHSAYLLDRCSTNSGLRNFLEFQWNKYFGLCFPNSAGPKQHRHSTHRTKHSR